jgi:hypothetical protein
VTDKSLTIRKTLEKLFTKVIIKSVGVGFIKRDSNLEDYQKDQCKAYWN